MNLVIIVFDDFKSPTVEPTLTTIMPTNQPTFNPTSDSTFDPTIGSPTTIVAMRTYKTPVGSDVKAAPHQEINKPNVTDMFASKAGGNGNGNDINETHERFLEILDQLSYLFNVVLTAILTLFCVCLIAGYIDANCIRKNELFKWPIVVFNVIFVNASNTTCTFQHFVIFVMSKENLMDQLHHDFHIWSFSILPFSIF